jgi:hypothetical protein
VELPLADPQSHIRSVPIERGSTPPPDIEQP